MRYLLLALLLSACNGLPNCHDPAYSGKGFCIDATPTPAPSPGGQVILPSPTPSATPLLGPLPLATPTPSPAPQAQSSVLNVLSSGGFYKGDYIAAVKAYQKAHGLTADGIVGPKTLAAMGLLATPTPVQTSTQSGAPLVSSGMYAMVGPLSWEKDNLPAITWSAILFSEVSNELFQGLSSATDLPSFCPKFAGLDRAHKAQAISEVLAQVAEKSSSMIKNVFALKADASSFKGCEKISDKTLANDALNIDCAAHLASDLALRDGVIAANGKGLASYWPVLRDGQKLSAIQASVSYLAFCH